jgi:hypothetical protein
MNLIIDTTYIVSGSGTRPAVRAQLLTTTEGTRNATSSVFH